MQQHGRSDPRHGVRRGLPPVERHPRAKVRNADGQRVHHESTEAEAHDPYLARAIRMVLQVLDRSGEVLDQLVAVQFRLQAPPVIVVAGVSPLRGQPVGSQG